MLCVVLVNEMRQHKNKKSAPKNEKRLHTSTSIYYASNATQTEKIKQNGIIRLEVMWSTILIAPPTYHTETNEDMVKNYPYHTWYTSFLPHLLCQLLHSIFSYVQCQPQGLLNLRRTQNSLQIKKERCDGKY